MYKLEECELTMTQTTECPKLLLDSALVIYNFLLCYGSFCRYKNCETKMGRSTTEQEILCKSENSARNERVVYCCVSNVKEGRQSSISYLC